MEPRLSLLCFVLIQLSCSAKPPDYRPELDSGEHGSYPVQKFVSSKLRAPEINFVQWYPDCDDGLHYFITPRGWKVSDPGPMILDGAGSLIWSNHFDNKFGGQAYDLKVQKYRGEDYLTFWLGDDTDRGHGDGKYYMLNSSYDIVHEISAKNDMWADLHDFVITPEGTALLVIFQPVKADVRVMGRKFNDLWNQAAWDCVFQEINIETGDLLFEWRASEHLELNLTYHKLDTTIGDSGTREKPFDWFHINSIDKDEPGNYLVSARNTHSILYIDSRTKKIIWTLGGKKNDFQDLSSGQVLNFAWQHDARFVALDAFPETYTAPQAKAGVTTKLMTIFDNAAMDWNYAYGPSYSRVLLLEVTYPATSTLRTPFPGLAESPTGPMHATYHTEWQEPLSKQDLDKVTSINGTNPAYTVRAVREFVNRDHVVSSTQGSAQLLRQDVRDKDPRFLVGYGINAVVTEFSSNGSVLCDMHFGAASSWEKGDVQSYRAFKFAWTGRPRQQPAIALRNDHIFVSWNGATECVEWVLQASGVRYASEDEWKELERVPKQGFETAVPAKSPVDGTSNKRYLRVIAFCKDGRPCERGTSDVLYQGRFSAFLSTEGLSGALLSYGIWAVVVFCAFFVASICLARTLRCLLPKRKQRRFEKSLLPRQRVD